MKKHHFFILTAGQLKGDGSWEYKGDCGKQDMHQILKFYHPKTTHTPVSPMAKILLEK